MEDVHSDSDYNKVILFTVFNTFFPCHGFAPGREARSWPGVTVAGGSKGLQVQRDESNDGRHSLGSCCPEDLQVRCQSPSGELTHAPADPRAPVQSDDGHHYISLGHSSTWTPHHRVRLHDHGPWLRSWWSP